jgi:LuxR family maltose regulon positive regulatory protein
MRIPLLTTKLRRPPLRSKIVSRPELIERLDSGLHRKLSLVSAPAGFGKTTLLSEWAARSRSSVAWVTLDKADGDPARFWAYVVAALQTVDIYLGDVVHYTFPSPRVPPVESLLTPLLNQLAEVPDPFALVLDDYHTIDAQPIHEGLTFLLAHLPPQMHLVIATRVDPPLPIARLRGRGELTGLYQADLRFKPEEAAHFLNRVMGLDLTAEDVAALERRTEGWIAGLQMAAVSLRGHDDVSGFVQAFTGSHRYILDYLTDEVLTQQPENVRQFLLQTSILDRLSAPLCDAVIEQGVLDGAQGTSRAILEVLDRSNLFIVPLDDERRWYRYHRLFADLLRQRLQRHRPALLAQLHRRASEWHQENDSLTEAVSHTLSARDFERAARLIEAAAWEMLTRGELTTLLEWLDALPDDLTQARPRLGILRAWALALDGRWQAAEPSLSPIDAGQVPGELAAVRAVLAAHRADMSGAVELWPRVVELSQEALEYLPQDKWFSRNVAALMLGTAYWNMGDLSAAGRAMAEAIALTEDTGHTYLTLLATSSLGQLQEIQGLLRQAVENHRRALALASKQGPRPAPNASFAHVGIAEVLYEWNDLDGAMAHALEGIELSDQGGRTGYLLAGQVVLARVHQAQGDVALALDVIEKAERVAGEYSSSFLYRKAELAALRARLWATRGDLAAASQWAEEHKRGPSDERHFSAECEVEQLGVAGVLIDTGKPAAALDLLGRLLQVAEETQRTKGLIRILVLQALAFQTQDDPGNALSALGRALSLAEPEGYVRTFLDQGEPMARLLRQALSQGIAPNYAARLLAAFDAAVELTPPSMDALVEPLTRRELEVLRLIVAGLSNSDIADELFIAVSTVKSHINHIYGKLGVENRVQAINRARSLQLL